MSTSNDKNIQPLSVSSPTNEDYIESLRWLHNRTNTLVSIIESIQKRLTDIENRLSEAENITRAHVRHSLQNHFRDKEVQHNREIGKHLGNVTNSLLPVYRQ